jgi:hypothetical protein
MGGAVPKSLVLLVMNTVLGTTPISDFESAKILANCTDDIQQAKLVETCIYSPHYSEVWNSRPN